MPAYSH